MRTMARVTRNVTMKATNARTERELSLVNDLVGEPRHVEMVVTPQAGAVAVAEAPRHGLVAHQWAASSTAWYSTSTMHRYGTSTTSPRR
jgi:hypothetical protein